MLEPDKRESQGSLICYCATATGTCAQSKVLYLFAFYSSQFSHKYFFIYSWLLIRESVCNPHCTVQQTKIKHNTHYTITDITVYTLQLITYHDMCFVCLLGVRVRWGWPVPMPCARRTGVGVALLYATHLATSTTLHSTIVYSSVQKIKYVVIYTCVHHHGGCLHVILHHLSYHVACGAAHQAGRGATA